MTYQQNNRFFVGTLKILKTKYQQVDKPWRSQIPSLRTSSPAGKLLDRVGVDRVFYEVARGLRDGMTTPSECEEVIAKELRHLLDTFSKDCTKNPARSSP